MIFKYASSPMEPVTRAELSKSILEGYQHQRSSNLTSHVILMAQVERAAHHSVCWVWVGRCLQLAALAAWHVLLHLKQTALFPTGLLLQGLGHACQNGLGGGAGTAAEPVTPLGVAWASFPEGALRWTICTCLCSC